MLAVEGLRGVLLVGAPILWCLRNKIGDVGTISGSLQQCIGLLSTC